MAYKSYFPSALGLITLTSNGKELTGLYFEGQKFAPNFEEYLEAPLEIFTKTKVYLVEHFNGNKPSFSLPLKPQGTDFQKLVWSSLITHYHNLRRDSKESCFKAWQKQDECSSCRQCNCT